MTIPGYEQFVCNLCNRTSKVVADFHREGGACQHCHANIRFRSLIHTLSNQLYEKSVPLSKFPTDWKIKAIGLSDEPLYANRLATLFHYTNYFYHQEPFLDICDIESMDIGSYDFLISSDVFEHVPPPRHTAFFNCSRLLKPGGFLLLTVPYTQLAKTVEHFPRLHQFGVIQDSEGSLLVNRCQDRTMEVYDGLTWHGGEGSTLEMRVFAETDLLTILADAGFKKILIWDQDVPKHGILQSNQGGSFVISAIKASDPIPTHAENHDPYQDNCFPEDTKLDHPLIHSPFRITGERAKQAQKQWKIEQIKRKNAGLFAFFHRIKSKLKNKFAPANKS